MAFNSHHNQWAPVSHSHPCPRCQIPVGHEQPHGSLCSSCQSADAWRYPVHSHHHQLDPRAPGCHFTSPRTPAILPPPHQAYSSQPPYQLPVGSENSHRHPSQSQYSYAPQRLEESPRLRQRSDDHHSTRSSPQRSGSHQSALTLPCITTERHDSTETVPTLEVLAKKSSDNEAKKNEADLRHKYAEKQRRDEASILIKATFMSNQKFDPAVIAKCKICAGNTARSTKHAKAAKNEMLEDTLYHNFSFVLHFASRDVTLEHVERLEEFAQDCTTEKREGQQHGAKHTKKWNADIESEAMLKVLRKIQEALTSHNIVRNEEKVNNVEHQDVDTEKMDEGSVKQDTDAEEMDVDPAEKGVKSNWKAIMLHSQESESGQVEQTQTHTELSHAEQPQAESPTRKRRSQDSWEIVHDTRCKRRSSSTPTTPGDST